MKISTSIFIKICILVCLIFSLNTALDQGKKRNLWESIIKDEKPSSDHVYVHLLTHSHDDIGWLKTLDDYYSGTNTNVVRANVKMIISTVIQELIKNPIRRFTQVEMKFFSMWWKDQSEEMKNQVREMIREGRLEIANGGWSMHDEACTHYDDMINNMKLGHDFLLKEIGVKPRIGWHVDPFGHSNTNARLFAEMGFDGWFFSRLDHQDKDLRFQNKTMEFVWRPSFQHLGVDAEIFTHAMFDGYCYFPGYWYDDRFGGDSPVVIDQDLETFNADWKASLMYDRIQDILKVYRGNHVLVMMGCDFTYTNAAMNFVSMDRLVEYFNANYQKVTLLYSTPSIYLDALKTQNLPYTAKYDDMFPYSDQVNSYWTGYFTSRPNSKKYIRDSLSNLYASNKLYSLKVLDQSATDEEIQVVFSTLFEIMNSQAINQHHDAVTGTAKQFVANDYNRIIHRAIQINNKLYIQLLNDIINTSTGISSDQWQWCERLNGTYIDCPINYNQQKDFITVVHNPSTVEQNYIRMKVSHGSYQVNAWNGSQFVETTDAAVICNERTIESGQNINDCDLHIKVNIKSDNFTLIYLKYDNTKDLTVKETQSGIHLITGKNESLNYTGTNEQGVLFDLIKSVGSNNTYKLAFDLRYYKSYQGGGWDGDNSGAYIFRPDDNNQSSMQYSVLSDIKSYNGGFVSEIFMRFQSEDKSRNAYVKLRYYDQSYTSEWEVYLAGIPEKLDNMTQGMEVTVNWKSFDIDNNNTFYTDSNGLEMQKRVLNYQPSYNFSSQQQVSGNYYPVNSAITIIDEQKDLQMTVMNDRSQGGSVVEAGRVELMQNRRLYFDDKKGVEEILNETDQYGNGLSVPATYKMQFIERKNEQTKQRETQISTDSALQYFFSFNWTQQEKIVSNLDNIRTQTQPLDTIFNFFVMPLERNKLHMRVENIGETLNIEIDMDSYLRNYFALANQKNSSVQLANITYVETSLTGNQEINEMMSKKIYWDIDGEEKSKNQQYKRKVNEDYTKLIIPPQKIRAFNVTFISDQSKQQEELFLQ